MPTTLDEKEYRDGKYNVLSIHLVLNGCSDCIESNLLWNLIYTKFFLPFFSEDFFGMQEQILIYFWIHIFSNLRINWDFNNITISHFFKWAKCDRTALDISHFTVFIYLLQRQRKAELWLQTDLPHVNTAYCRFCDYRFLIFTRYAYVIRFIYCLYWIVFNLLNL